MLVMQIYNNINALKGYLPVSGISGHREALVN